MADHCEVRMTVGTNGEAANIFGKHDENLRFIENNCAAKIVARGNELTISGPREAVEVVQDLFGQLVALAQAGNPISIGTINYALTLLARERNQKEKLAAGPPG